MTANATGYAAPAEPAALYPLFANLRGCRVLVVGGGAVAERKVDGLLEAGATVEVVAPRLASGLQRRAEVGLITHHAAEFAPRLVAGAWLVIAASDDDASNRAVAAAAARNRVFVNVVDDVALSRFQVPARVRRGAITVAISTAGVAPVLARRLRAELETVLDRSLGDLARMLARFRGRIRAAIPNLAARRRFYDDILDGPAAGWLRKGRPDKAAREVVRRLAAPAVVPRGRVTLVGAGPGDPDLLTLKGLRALQQADVILHDRLGAAVLDLARRDAERIDVGKRSGGDHDATQQRIHGLMLEHARAGRHVVRLKGGDPLIFGRGGEELAFLREHDIAYEVVPGITAAIACAAYAGVPLTQRGVASSLLVTTPRRGAGSVAGAWCGDVDRGRTLAIYMGVSQLPEIERALLAKGWPATTPVALIENGTSARQRVVSGKLDDLVITARRHRVQAPALLIVGEVAALATKLAWFGNRIDDDVAAIAAADAA